MDRLHVQHIALQLLGQPGDHRLGRGQHYFAEKVATRIGGAPRLSAGQVMEVFWSLISQGLAYIDMTQSAPENWSLELTGAGRAALSDHEFNPDDASGYLSGLVRTIPEISPLVKRYAEESVRAYNSQLYLASSVMLGVASEAVFQETAETFAAALQGDTKKRFLEILSEPKVSYVQKFTEFNKRINPFREELPDELRENYDLHVNATLDLIRVYRNNAGHPTGRTVGREDCFLNLRVGATYLRRMYTLKKHFEEKTPS